MYDQLADLVKQGAFMNIDESGMPMKGTIGGVAIVQC